MTQLTHILYTRLRQAQALIRECGWVQNRFGDATDGYCITGAIRATGLDGLHVVLRRLVALHNGVEFVETLNDEQLINRFEAIQALDFRPTEAMLEQAYGPHYDAVVGLIRQLSHLTDAQVRDLEQESEAEMHAMQYRALLAASANADVKPYLDTVTTDMHLALMPTIGGTRCWAVVDQVAVTQLAWDRINRGELSVTLDQLAPANALFAQIIGVQA